MREPSLVAECVGAMVAAVAIPVTVKCRIGVDEQEPREALFTFAAGPLYFRMFIAGRKVEPGFIDSVVESVCRLYCTPAKA